MDPVRNPFAPGAGNQPPELAGRQDILDRAEVTLARAEQGRHAKSFMLIGLRGVGKTVLLNRTLQLAEQRGLRRIAAAIVVNSCSAKILIRSNQEGRLPLSYFTANEPLAHT